MGTSGISGVSAQAFLYRNECAGDLSFTWYDLTENSCYGYWSDGVEIMMGALLINVPDLHGKGLSLVGYFVDGNCNGEWWTENFDTPSHYCILDPDKNSAVAMSFKVELFG